MGRHGNINMPPAPTIRFQARRAFITYPQATRLSKQIIYDFFFGKHPGLTCLRVGQELHEDGNTHFHVYIDFGSEFTTRITRYWDIDGHHPNIESVRQPKASYDYCGKDGDTQDFGVPPADKESQDSKWRAVIDAVSPAAALLAAKEASPRDYVINYDKITSFIQLHHRITVPEYSPPLDLHPWILNQDIMNWELQRSPVNVR